MRSGVDAGHATASGPIPWHYFVRFDLASTWRLTDFWQDVSLSIDGGAQTWTSYPMQVPALSQSNQNPLDVSYISLANMDGSWNARAFGGVDQFREMPVKVWLVQFDPATFPNTLTIKGSPLMFDGRIAGADMAADGWLKITINPNASNWNATSLFLINPNCPFDFKGPECGYVGVLTSCLRTRADCVLHSNTARFGGSDFMPPIDVELAWGTLTATLPVLPIDNTSVLRVPALWETVPRDLIRPTGGGGTTRIVGGR